MKQNETLLCELARAAKMGKDSVAMLMKKTDDAPMRRELMREMSEVAPGTFRHSLQLANLTAAAANRIGANSQLVRTGAMCHDIGKMLNPAFFTENQTGVNPHDQLSYKQSAQIVINHVIED